MINFFSNIFGYVLNWIYLLVQNYGLAIIIFSVLIKILMLPLSIKQQRTLKINEKLQKEIKILQIKYKGNQEKINQETMELYKREKVNPLSGCFTIIIQFILILSMFYLVRSPLTYMKKIDNTRIEEQINIVKETNENQNINNSYPEIAIIRYLQENNMKENDMYINMNFLGLDLSKVPQENLKDITVYIIPVLYVISSIISIKFTTNLSKNKNKEEVEESKDLINTKENKEIDQEEMAMQMNKNMSLMMPILSVSISLLAPLGLALYWLINNIIMIIERLVLNKFFSKEENENAK
jgi:YidC/Oxa1 family membrane protein insertase